jgi:RNA polymerase sigma factor (sigma-70 family)
MGIDGTAGVPTAPAGVDALFRREHTSMLIVGSRAEAEEAVQDAFIAVADRWDTIEHPAAYLRVTVVNRCRMVLRRRGVERRHAAASLPEIVDAPEHLIELRDALHVLGERERAAIVLRYLVDLPDDEIATALDCRPATVRSLVHRALAKLRKELA